MNRNEYMLELEKALDEFDAETKSEIILDYSEHFDTGIKNGKTEDRICGELGPISDMIAELRMLQNTYETETAFNAVSGPENPTSVDYTPNFTMVDAGPVADEVAGEPDNNTAPSGSGTGADTGYFEGSRSSGSRQPGRVVVDGLCASVYVKRSLDGMIRVNYENHGSEEQQRQYHFTQYTENDVFHAELIDTRAITKWWYINKRTTPSIDIYLEVPDNLEITIKNKSSDIEVEKVKAKRLSMESLSGDVSIFDCRADILDLKSKTGDVNVRQVTSGYITASSMSGCAEVRNVLAGNLMVSAISGDVSVIECKINNVAASSVSGEVEVTRGEYEDVSAESKSGDIDASIRCTKSAFKSISGDVDVKVSSPLSVSVKSTSGDVDLELNACTGYSVDLHTVSGSSRCSFGDRDICTKTGRFSFGDASCTVCASTVSGDIDVTA